VSGGRLRRGGSSLHRLGAGAAIARRPSPGGLGCVLALLLTAATAWAQPQQIITLESRSTPDGQRVTLDYLLDRPEAGAPHTVLVALWRGTTRLDFAKRAQPVRFLAGEMFAMRSRQALIEAGFALAFPDLPSDQRTLSLAFRRDTRHAADIAAVVQDLRKRMPGARVLLLGDTTSGTSAVHAAARLGKGIDGTVLIGADYNNLRTFDFGRIPAPVLTLHHVDDACVVSPLLEAREAAARHGHTLVAFEGGNNPEPVGACGNLSFHGLAGLESQVVDTVAAWSQGKPLPAASSARTGMHEEVVMMPGRGFTQPALELTLYRPDGPGPFPLAVINHGRSNDQFEVKQFQRRVRFTAQAREFVRRGFAVLVPARSGQGRSGGSVPQTSCEISRHGLEDATEIRTAIEFAARLPYVDATRIVLVGQSAGGLAVQALASQKPEGVRAVINFAGVLRLSGSAVSDACWFDGVVAAFSTYLKSSTVPSLWVYTSNDSYFDGRPERVTAMHEAVVKSGAKPRLVLLPAFGSDGHALFGDEAGVKLWLPEVEAFLRETGLLPSAP
jgi:dienelactone hydrolase